MYRPALQVIETANVSFVGRAVHDVLLRFIFTKADRGVAFCSITHSPNHNLNLAFSDFAMSRFHATSHLLQQASVISIYHDFWSSDARLRNQRISQNVVTTALYHIVMF